MANDTNSVDALLQAAQFLEAANDGESGVGTKGYGRFPICASLICAKTV